MADTLMSAYAMFATKAPSMLAFEDRLRELRIEKPFKINKVPSDTQMREILDGIDIEPLNEAFADLFWELQRGRELKQWLFDGQYYLIAIDGSGYFCSDKISCEHCLVRRTNGKDQYYHQVVAAVLVHPNTRQVIPMAVEPIVRSDGDSKNDCERNATKRLLKRLRKQHPKLNMLVVEDGLSSNAPHIADLRDAKMHFLLGAKPGDHKHLFEQAIEAMDQDACRTQSAKVAAAGTVTQTETQYIKDLSLNKSNADVRINFLQHFEFDCHDGEVVKRFSWVTDIDLSEKDLHVYQRGGRCRWRVENETFNTLKNQGYHLEHNYGHGSENLTTVLALLMFLAFTVDQIQEACCGLFVAAMNRTGRRIRLWESIRSHLRHFDFGSFAELYHAIAAGTLTKPPPVR
ncbi:MAG: transposase [Pirellulaceae bacterium]